MTDDIGKYTFDFEKEARDLRRSLPSRGKGFLFTEASVAQPEGPDAPAQVDLLHAVGNQQFKNEYLPMVNEWIKHVYSNDPDESSQVSPPFIERDRKTVTHIVAIREKEYASKMLGEENEALMRLFILYHETAHVLLPGAASNNDNPVREAAADAYAALRFFQRFGPDAQNILSMISWNRSFQAVLGDTSHLTTTVLDKIIADSAMKDFSKLKPAEIVNLAESYAREWTPEPSVLIEARPLFTQGMSINFPRLAETSLASSNDLAFYIGSKFFHPYLHPEGIVQNGETIQIPDEQRQRYTAAITKRAAGTDLQKIFGAIALQSETATSVSTLLKVSRPRDQKPFTVNI